MARKLVAEEFPPGDGQEAHRLDVAGGGEVDRLRGESVQQAVEFRRVAALVAHHAHEVGLLHFRVAREDLPQGGQFPKGPATT